MNKRVLILTIIFLLIAAAVFAAIWMIYHYSEGDFYYDISQDVEKIENSNVAYICDPAYYPTSEDINQFLTDNLTSPAMLYFLWNRQTYRSDNPAVKEKIAAVFQKESFCLEKENTAEKVTEICALNNAAYQILITHGENKTFLELWNRKTSSHRSFVTESDLGKKLDSILSEAAKESKLITNANELTQFE